MTVPTGTLTVVVHHELDITRIGLRTLIDAESDLEVVADISEVGRIPDLLDRLQPQVLIMSLNAIKVLESPVASARRPRHRPAMLILAAQWDERAVNDALRLGARGIVCDRDAARFVVDAARAVGHGGAFLSPLAITRLIDRIVDNLPDADAVDRIRLADLTNRECEVLRFLATGLTTNELAETLGVTAATVKSHLSHILGKLGVRDRVQAAALAHRAGLR